MIILIRRLYSSRGRMVKLYRWPPKDRFLSRVLIRFQSIPKFAFAVVTVSAQPLFFDAKINQIPLLKPVQIAAELVLVIRLCKSLLCR
ncbi:MAG TPA: hypothetical protein VJ879_14590 [Desulfobacter sp.]|nr:hypothetical protein [Desulfobacter sp.]